MTNKDTCGQCGRLWANHPGIWQLCRELKELAHAAAQCRSAQKLYFLERSRDNLAHAKKCEKALDNVLRDILNLEPDQI